jgi:hypothetical protein
MEGYQLSTSEYAKREGVSAMTVRRWKNKGAPLDNPEAMRVFRTNEKSRTSVSKSNHRRTSSPQTSHTTPHTSSLTSCAPNQPKSPKKTKVNRPHVEVGKHIGMRPGIKRLQEAEVQRYADYQEAVAGGDIAVIKACQEVWLNVFEQLRRVEVTNPEVEKSNKESVAIAKVEIELNKILSAVRTALDAHPDRAAHKLVGLDVAAIRAVLKQEVTVICRHLVEWKEIQQRERI